LTTTPASAQVMISLGKYESKTLLLDLSNAGYRVSQFDDQAGSFKFSDNI